MPQMHVRLSMWLCVCVCIVTMWLSLQFQLLQLMVSVHARVRVELRRNTCCKHWASAFWYLFIEIYIVFCGNVRKWLGKSTDLPRDVHWLHLWSQFSEFVICFLILFDRQTTQGKPQSSLFTYIVFYNIFVISKLQYMNCVLATNFICFTFWAFTHSMKSTV